MHPRHPLLREAVLSAAAAARHRSRPRLARPAGHRPRGARVPADALPRARLHALEQLLVRGPLQLRQLQPPLLPARRAARDPAARGARRSRSPRSRSRSCSGASGARRRAGRAGAFARRLGRSRPLGGVPVRARRRARAARALRAAGGRALALRRARGADARGEPGRVRPARRSCSPGSRSSQRASLRGNWLPVAGGRGRRRVRARALAALPGRRPLPVLASPRPPAGSSFCALGSPSRGGSRARACCASSSRVYTVAFVASYLVPSAIGENIARLRYARSRWRCSSLSLRRWRPLPLGLAVLALALSWNMSPLAASYVNGQARLTAAPARVAGRVALPARAPRADYRVEAVDTSGHWPAVYLARRGHPARPRLVPAGRLPAEPAALQQARRGRVPRLAAPARREVRRPHGRAAGLQRARRGGARRERPRRARAGLRDADADDLRRAAPDADRHRAGAPRLESLTEARMDLVVAQAGRYRIAVRWCPYWQASAGCLSTGRTG